jgi:hypothetical protein
MLSYSTWNDLMDRFLGELSAAFPSRKSAVDAVRTGMTAATLLDDASPCKMFVAHLMPYANRVASRDGSMFDEIGEVAGVELGDMYAEADEASRSTIFEYVETLMTLGTHLISGR